MKREAPEILRHNNKIILVDQLTATATATASAIQAIEIVQASLLWNLVGHDTAMQRVQVSCNPR